jgi:heavy metal sensor kinase
MINPRSLHFRLIVWHTVLLSAVALAFGFYTYLGLQHYLVSSLETTLERRSEQIAGSLVSHLPDIGEEKLKQEIQILYAPEQNNRFIRVTDYSGAIIYTSGVPKDVSFAPDEIPLPKVATPLNRSESTLQGNQLYIATVPIAPTGSNHHYYVEVGSSDFSIQSTLQGLISTLFMGFPVLIILAVGGGYFLVERSLSSVSAVMRAAEDISLHNLSKRLPIVHTGDKLEQLSQALNRMIGRLEESFQHVSRFTADASHELRTPLTLMRGELELIVEQPHLPADLRQQVGNVFEETERLMRITEGLLSIARLEAGEIKMELGIFDLSELTASTADQLRLLAEEKHITLQVSTKATIHVQGDAARIKQVIVNLIDNAIKYTPENGVVHVLVRSENSRAKFEVQDNGIGIAPEHISHIFDRFYRTDAARSRGVGGTGIGLSIVRSICHAHGGSVDIQSTEGKGTKVILELSLMNTQEQV